MHIELRTKMTTDEIESADADENLIIPLPPTADSWSLLQDVDSGDDVSLTSADGDVFIGDVLDWDEDHYALMIELR